MAKPSGICLIAISICMIGVLTVANGASVETPDSGIGLDDIVNVMKQDFEGGNSLEAFKRSRYLLPPNNIGRDRMQAFLKHKFGSILGVVGGKDNGHVLHQQFFDTTIRVGNKPVRVDGVNFLVVISPKENNTNEDMPLVLLANYDTDTPNNAENPVEDNGSGIAALLVIGKKIAEDINSEKLKLRHTIILAAVDASLQKYATDGIELGSTTGSAEVANKFLPEFLMNRPKGIRGVIVLDNLLNYQEGKSSQNGAGFDRSYPKSYKDISAGNFAGDFLALVARGDELDKQLVQTIEEEWKQIKTHEFASRDSGTSGAENSGSEHGGNIPSPSPPIEPRLIKFTHNVSVNDGHGEGYIHFLKSDQTSFWNHKSSVIPPYPAILLTDTRSYRASICPVGGSHCDVFDKSTSDNNLQFVHRTIVTVYKTISRLQSGGVSRVSSMLTFIPILLVTIRHFFL